LQERHLGWAAGSNDDVVPVMCRFVEYFGNVAAEKNRAGVAPEPDPFLAVLPGFSNWIAGAVCPGDGKARRADALKEPDHFFRLIVGFAVAFCQLPPPCLSPIDEAIIPLMLRERKV